jgi:uncharacterized membrane protein YphA (DoxX/SURF4 family)
MVTSGSFWPAYPFQSCLAFPDREPICRVPCNHLGLRRSSKWGQEMTDFDNRLNAGWWALRIGLGVGPIITGIDKFFNKLTDWGMYLSPLATRIVPVSATIFMRAIGVVEIIAGLIVLSRWTRLGSYIVMLWLIGIAVNLLTTGMFYDLAMRDVEIAIGAFALSQLTAVREQRPTARQGA